MKIQFNDLGSQWEEIKLETLPKIESVLSQGNYILGEPVQEFENDFAKWNNNKYSIGVSNGTDAIKIAFKSLNLKGSVYVLIPANTYISTILSVEDSNTPNITIDLVDCDKYYQISTEILETKLRENRKKYDNCVVIPVHLYGHCCDMKTILKLKSIYDFKILEDCSQAHGTKGFDGKNVGTYGDISAFSLYPGKNLGAAGDAGIITTDNQDYFETCKTLRNIGSKEKYVHIEKGWNNRLDTIQSVILSAKLKKIDEWNRLRNKIAQRYLQEIINKKIDLPLKADYCEYHTYHIFCLKVKKRVEFIEYMRKFEIPILIHYPISIENSICYNYLTKDNELTNSNSNFICSLPMHPFLNDESVDFIIKKINEY